MKNRWAWVRFRGTHQTISDSKFPSPNWRVKQWSRKWDRITRYRIRSNSSPSIDRNMVRSANGSCSSTSSQISFERELSWQLLLLGPLKVTEISRSRSDSMAVRASSWSGQTPEGGGVTSTWITSASTVIYWQYWQAPKGVYLLFLNFFQKQESSQMFQVKFENMIKQLHEALFRLVFLLYEHRLLPTQGRNWHNMKHLMPQRQSLMLSVDSLACIFW